MADNQDLLRKLFKCNIFKTGNFKLKSGSFSPVYIDLRQVITSPDTMTSLADAIRKKQLDENVKTDVVCGVPYTALPIVSIFCSNYNIPMVMKRKELKRHGTMKMVEGANSGDLCLIVEDIVSTGTSVVETAEALRKEGLKVQDCIVIVNRNQGGAENLEKVGIKLYHLFDINDIFESYCSINPIEADLAEKIKSYFKDYLPIAKCTSKSISYAERAKLSTHKVARKLFEIMNLKKTNLCVAVDTNSFDELLKLANQLGPHICILKTHVDILDDFCQDKISELRNLSTHHNFLILEDRKFADIGNTVKHQFFKGIYKIQSWADMVTAHAIPGNGIIEALRNETCACILIAEMSCKGALTNDEYKENAFKIAEENSDYVIGYVAQRGYSNNSFIHMCPGVNLTSTEDALGQQYNSPEAAIANGADIIIVGRGICTASDVVAAAIKYKTRSYSAYLKSILN